jgi:succinyl-diaminopimelate desuccinylase
MSKQSLISSSSVKNKVLTDINDRSKEIWNLCSNVIRRKSENPPGDTTEIASFLQEYLESFGLSTRVYRVKKHLPNIVASVGPRNGKSVVYNAHMDTYQAEVTTGKWKVPPFSGRLVDGKIYGRGAVDMKGGLTCIVSAMTVLRKYERELDGRAIITLVSDEENMGKLGTEWLLDNVKEVSTADACLSPEPTAPRLIGIAEKGIMFLRIRAYGKSTHGAYPVQGDNAIHKICDAISVARSLHWKKITPPPELVPLLKDQRKYWKKLGIGILNELLERITISVSKIEGGKFIGLVPDFCQVEINTRTPPGEKTDYIENTIRRLVEKAHLDVEIESSVKNQPYMTSPKEEIVSHAKNNVREIIGFPAVVGISIGGTDQWRFRARGIPSVKYGPEAHNMGAPNEYVSAKELVDVTKVHTSIALDFLNG